MGGLSMDQAFVQAPEHRTKANLADADGIPVVDLSPLAAGDKAGVDALAAEVGRASRDWGFFVVVRHGVPAETVAQALEAQRAFFALPADRKAAVRRDEAAPLGYYESEHTKNVRDWKEVFDIVPREPPPPAAVADGELVFENKWPEDLPGFRYDLALGVGRHKDAGALTILYQDDVGGLDVRRRSDGEWVRVRPVPDSYVINVGDIIQVWSNDRYESAEHRVSVNSEKERFSMPYFFNPGSDAMVEPLEEMVSDERPARYDAYNWGNFFSTRKNSNFRKLDVENVQIAHFRKDRP
uniref:Fe2OG dioxygenase domain-containing protein n=1 Tax=Aegilops tauschii subsp. strangulata TaxID=200361 RepID=A0A453HF89_AEGTS